MDDTRAWVRGEVDGEWLEARVVSRDADGGATLETLSTKEQSTAKAEELLLANELPEQGVEDMTRLNYLHEPALLNNLRHRFLKDRFSRLPVFVPLLQDAFLANPECRKRGRPGFHLVHH